MFKIACFFIYILFANEEIFSTQSSSESTSESFMLEQYNKLSEVDQIEVMLETLQAYRNKIKQYSIANTPEILDKLDNIEGVLRKILDEFRENEQIPEADSVDFDSQDIDQADNDLELNNAQQYDVNPNLLDEEQDELLA